MVRSFSGRPVDPAVLDAPPRPGDVGPDGRQHRRLGRRGPASGPTRPPRSGRRPPPRSGGPGHGAGRGCRSAPVVVALFADPAAYVARYAEPDKAGAGAGLAAPWATAPRPGRCPTGSSTPGSRS